MAWQSFDSGQDPSSTGILARRVDHQGVPLATEFLVNSWTTGFQNYPDVAMGAEGHLVVVWTSFDQDGSGPGIFGQRYDQLGDPAGGEFQVNSWTTNEQRSATVSMDRNGGFVVAWQSYLQNPGASSDVFARRYDADGNPIGGEFQVNSYTTAEQQAPAVAPDGNGNFVVAWESSDINFGNDQDGDGAGVFAQRFETTRIGDRVWSDADVDGVQDEGEAGVANVPVHLFDSFGTPLDSTVTDADGEYLFSVIPPIDVYVEFELPSPYDFSPLDQGGDDSVDSDADVTTGETATFTIAPGELADTWDAGLDTGEIFRDGFEMGSTSAWSSTTP